MQISKCIKKCKNKLKGKIDFLPNTSTTSKKAQNLVEFVFVFPMLIFMTLVIFEVAFFWQEANSIYDLNAEINANVALLDYSNMPPNSKCPAADEANPNSAISIFKKRQSMISLTDSSYLLTITDPNPPREPFALYKYNSTTDVHGQPQLSITIDCRNPFEDGITTQVEFYHKTVVMKATIPRFDKPEGIVIIPDNVFIASPKLTTLRHY